MVSVDASLEEERKFVSTSSSRGSNKGHHGHGKAKKGAKKSKKKVRHAEKYGAKTQNKYFTRLTKIEEKGDSSESEEEGSDSAGDRKNRLIQAE